MKRDITPDMYNYNKFPGPKFERLADRVQTDGIELSLVENYKDGFDLTAFEQRFSGLMLKFDYIVGDWGNGQLRLKGFYKDDKPVARFLKISRLEDYLIEYCNYGCAYFVLENPNPQELEPEKEDRGRRKRSRRKPRNRRPDDRRPADKDKGSAGKSQTGGQDKSQGRRRKRKPARHFSIRQEEKEQEKLARKQIQEAKRGFVIRQKDDRPD